MPHRRLVLAFAVSLLLHAAALVDGQSAPPAMLSAPPLQATLRPPPATPAPAEALLKNTLDDESERPLAVAPELPPAIAPTAAPKAAPRPAKAPAQQVQAAQRKLAEHLFYPAEAIAGNLEGEVRLILTLAPDGGIADVQLAASSGHRLLDDAAVLAAWAMGRLPGVAARELILPVIFRLQ
jgi:protein TonB